MLVTVDPASAEPLYQQIASQLRSAIGRGELPPGHRLPPARELAEALGVNMHTVLRAYGALRDDELVEMRRRRGVIVRRSGDTRARLIELVRALRAEASRQGVGLPELQRLLEEVA
jgi:GntR family transcriptional regulator